MLKVNIEDIDQSGSLLQSYLWVHGNDINMIHSPLHEVKDFRKIF